MKNHTYLLLGIALAATASAAIPSLKENLSEALYTESVLRTPETAAGMFAKIVESYRNAGSPAELSEHAAAALFRLAEIRDEEGADKEAEKLYRELLDQFPKHEPQAGLARRKLGLSGPDARTTITELDEEAEDTRLSGNVFRKCWFLNSEHDPEDLLLTTFRVSHKEGYANEGLPPGFEITVLHHVPSGRSAQLISRTIVSWPKELIWADDGEVRWERRNIISAFGQTYEVPEGLTWISAAQAVATVLETSHASMTFDFDDKRQYREKDAVGDSRYTEATRGLTVTLNSKPVSPKEAMSLLEPSGMKLPEMGAVGWSLTVPPPITKLEE
jgi:hypothetical protein